MEERERAIQDKKDRLKRALDNNTVLDGDLRRDAIELAKKAKWDDEGPQRAEAEGDGGGGVATRDSQGKRSSMEILENSVLRQKSD